MIICNDEKLTNKTQVTNSNIHRIINSTEQCVLVAWNRQGGQVQVLFYDENS